MFNSKKVNALTADMQEMALRTEAMQKTISELEATVEMLLKFLDVQAMREQMGRPIGLARPMVIQEKPKSVEEAAFDEMLRISKEVRKEMASSWTYPHTYVSMFVEKS